MLVDNTGRSWELGGQLAAGGEGIVYSLAGEAGMVAKLYKQPPSSQTVDKLRRMTRVSSPPLRRVAAWPTALLLSKTDGPVVGFMMPRFGDHQPIYHLYNPAQRIKFFPLANWAFLVHTARNCAAAFEEVHRADCLIGDINQSNLLVSRKATVGLIDCDSFQVRSNGTTYLCEVGVPIYTPPELQGRPYRGLVRTVNHDRFGLALLIFQLLFMGRHPYAGRYLGAGDMPLEKAIAEYRFAYGRSAPSLQMDRPPHTLSLADVSTELANLFERAFGQGSAAPDARPTATEWTAALDRFRGQLRPCPTEEGHVFLPALMASTVGSPSGPLVQEGQRFLERGIRTVTSEELSDYWTTEDTSAPLAAERNVPLLAPRDCPWCAIATNGGPNHFRGVGQIATVFAPNLGRLATLWARIEGLPPPSFKFESTALLPKTSPDPEPIPDIPFHRLYGRILGTVVVVGLMLCLGSVAWSPLAAFGVALNIVFLPWWIYHRVNSPRERERRARTRAVTRTLGDFQAIERHWENIVSGYQAQFQSVRQQLESARADCQRLKPRYEEEQAKLVRNKKALARDQFLKTQFLVDFDIPMIGAGRKQVLASYGLETAFDLDVKAIEAIRGFGEALTKSLMDWKGSRQAAFQFDPKSGVPESEMKALVAQFRRQEAARFAQLDEGAEHLRTLTAQTEQKLKDLEPELRSQAAALAQARANMAEVFRR